MITLTISNQRGGVGKTTTTLTLARSLAEQGNRVLVIDTDSQGSIYLALGLAPAGWLHQFVNDGLSITRGCHQGSRPHRCDLQRPADDEGRGDVGRGDG